MHPLLENINLFDISSLTEENVKDILTEARVLPEKISAPMCPTCGSETSANRDSSRKLGWMWICKKKNQLKCSGKVNPTSNTFFENVKIHILDVFVLIVCFIVKLQISLVLEQLNMFRRRRGQPQMSWATIVDFYSRLREVAEIIGSHHDKLLGGPGKTILLDETFLTKRKYNKGRKTKTMTQVVLGIYCRDDKEGIFFLVDGEKKKDLWPRIARHCNPETSVICTDSATQYHNINKLFNDAIHKTTNHKKGEFVNKTDKLNTINPLENENRHFKKSIVSRKSEKSIIQYMALHFYRRTRLNTLKSLDAKVQMFLEDISWVFPGYGKEGLQLKKIEAPTVESEGISDMMPKTFNKKLLNALSDDDEVPFVDDEDGDPNWEEF
ncbi:DDE_Tnp_IS1595 domain-containing protein [Trichonephila clavata]|uniref:DDE_Tnp_IS1595 domain-containing protein n=1 Tax=Trichonephila clavata TaxID=2740835 RepID=A0A8X6KBN2_TRICU|nr:DDE_Tnp_IS1595 domain-containing protein [Trichonephila clavata]